MEEPILIDLFSPINQVDSTGQFEKQEYLEFLSSGVSQLL